MLNMWRVRELFPAAVSPPLPSASSSSPSSSPCKSPRWDWQPLRSMRRRSLGSRSSVAAQRAFDRF
ncbi:hypothetical protein JZ751_007197 [Albula glossodonta]|uniref:Uncharacterized protein n=1 Tax=Albula glossodonta TaxID=121402 RepID=A0A8T2PBF7_9TELE|nr:hypothetical protein JZ751_007197 [Albula glossodonta]